MKRYFNILCVSVCLLIIACNNTTTNDPENIYGNKARPDWKEVTSSDISVSMTSVVKIDLSKKYPKTTDISVAPNDLLAAFAGSQCCGVASPTDGLFFLYISDPNGDVKTISLRYYSSVLKNVFCSEESFDFINDSRKGTVNNPFVPTFIVEK